MVSVSEEQLRLEEARVRCHPMEEDTEYYISDGSGNYMRYDGKWFGSMSTATSPFYKNGGTYFKSKEDAEACLAEVRRLAFGPTGTGRIKNPVPEPKPGPKPKFDPDLRNRLAEQAMVGVLSGRHHGVMPNCKTLASECYKIADAMIKEGDE